MVAGALVDIRPALSVATARRILDTGPNLSRWWRTMDELALRASESVEATALRMGPLLNIQPQSSQ